jgi:uncharacterized protein (DUF2147 family)
MKVMRLVIPAPDRARGDPLGLSIPGLTQDPSRSPHGTRGWRVKPAVTAVAGLLFAAVASAQAVSPVGLWHNIDDKTGQPRAEIRVSESGGVVTATIVKRLAKDAKPNAACDECTDDRKGKPVDGLEIVRGARKAADRDVWEGGKILDPENGREYTLRMTPVDGGKRMEVRGSIGPFGRTQTWVRVQ